MDTLLEVMKTPPILIMIIVMLCLVCVAASESNLPDKLDDSLNEWRARRRARKNGDDVKEIVTRARSRH